MTIELRIFIAIICILFFGYTLLQVKRNRLMLRYSLVWLVLAAVLFVFSIFTGPISVLSSMIGFLTPANFVLFIGLFFVLLMSLSYARAISEKNTQITRLTQQIALLEKRLDDQESSSLGD